MSTIMLRAVRLLAACLVAVALASCKCDEQGAPAAADAGKGGGGAPKIVAVEQSFDFGKVKQGDEVVHVFRLRNEGKGELRIEKARGS